MKILRRGEKLEQSSDIQGRNFEGEKKAAEGLRYMNIIGHVTKKMTAVIYAIMRDNKAYTPIMPSAA